MSAVVSVQSVGMIYNTPEGETHALRDVTFDVAPGEFVSIVGPSGCGKSTLLSLICGLIRPTSGRVLIQGEAVEGPSRHVGYMLQSDYLFGWRTVLSNCLLGLEIRKERTPERVREVWELLELMGLKDFAHRYPYQLSGGMRQRAALVRTLALRPNVVLLDEPFGALDYQTRLHLEGEVAELLRSRGADGHLDHPRHRRSHFDVRPGDRVNPPAGYRLLRVHRAPFDDAPHTPRRAQRARVQPSIPGCVERP